MEEITNRIKRNILAQKIEVYKNTIYDASLDVKVAEMLEEEAAVLAGKKRIKQALMAIDLLKKDLEALVLEEENDQ